MSARALSLKLATSERFSPYKIYPMRTIKIKYAILYLLSRHLMNTIYSTITSVVTFYSPHIPKLSAYALNINRGRGTRRPLIKWFSQPTRRDPQVVGCGNRLIRGMLVHLQPLAASGDMHLTFVRPKGTVRDTRRARARAYASRTAE